MESAIRNAGRFMAEAGCDAVKLEGGAEMADRVTGIARAGIPVIGHLGLTPQSVSALGGFRLQGKGAAQAKKIVDDARALEEAGAFCILLELVPDRVCRLITERAEHCIIMSLGSGPDAHGQLLIYHDAFALYPKFTPRMAKVFADAGAVIRDGPRGLRRRGDRADLPAARELVRHEGRGVRRAREAARHDRAVDGADRRPSQPARDPERPARRPERPAARPGARGSSTTCWPSSPATGRPRRSTARPGRPASCRPCSSASAPPTPAYLADLEWLAGERDRGAFVSVADFRRGVLGARADTTAFRDDMAVTLEVSALQYFPWVIAAARKAIAERSLMPARWIQVRRMKEQEAEGDLPAIAAAMQIIGASFVETLDTKGTDGSNVHLGGPATITGYFGGIGQPNDHPLLWLDEFLHYYTEYGVRQVLNINPGTVLAGYLLHRLGVDIEFKISVFMGNDNPYAGLWTLIGAKLFARDDGTSPLVGFNWGNSANNETLEITAEVRRALGFEDVVRFEHHITETFKSIVLQPYDRRDELVALADHVPEHLGQARGRRPGGGRSAGPPLGHPGLLPGRSPRSSRAATGRTCSSTSWTSWTPRTTRRGR